jgi:hypothetical protein
MDDRESFLAAARVAGDLVRRPEVAERWEQESACSGMTVGGLANHLGDQATLAVRLLEAGPSAEPPISLDEHYRLAAWVREDLEGETNVAIREGSDAQVRAGRDALVERVEADVARLPGVLESVAPDMPVFIPWQGWAAVTAHDLLTRIAVRRHGQAAVVRALSRPQRAPTSVSAF